MWNRVNRVLTYLLSMKAALLYILLFAVAIGAATFIENDFGTSAAQKVIYRSKWFEVLLALFCGSLIYNVFKMRMWKKEKWTLLLFHLSFIVILLGSAITRYFGYEGVMHIRENESSSHFISAETFINLSLQKDGQTYEVHEPVLFASLGKNSFRREYMLGGKLLEIEATSFTPNPKLTLVNDPNGKPTITMVMGGANGREEFHIQEGERRTIRGVRINFNTTPVNGVVNIRMEDGKPQIQLPESMTTMVMSTQEKDTLLPQTWYPLMLRQLYSNTQFSFVFSNYSSKAVIETISEEVKMKSESLGAVNMRVSYNGQTQEGLVYGQKGVEGRPRPFVIEDLIVNISYGSKKILLPFSIYLDDFELEKYPGTNSASSYASQVTLKDKRKNEEFGYRIYMNNILDHGGYRFFQSSYDQDELGTYLSVNHDFWGTWISYLGYFLLTIGMIFSLFSPSSRFSFLKKRLGKMRAAGMVVVLVLMISGLQAQQGPPVISADHADRFAEIVVQDHRGRLKPIHTMASEVLRKVSRRTSYNGMDAQQVLLSMSIFPEAWTNEPLIKLGKHKNILSQLGTSEKWASYADFFNTNGTYKLKDAVRGAHNMKSVDRTMYEKELLKIDERLNIVSLALKQSFLKVFPIMDENNTWISPVEIHQHSHIDAHHDPFIEQFFPLYSSVIHEAVINGDYTMANKMLDDLKAFQQEKGSQVIPSPSKIKAEILLNKSQIFSNLGKVYGIMGLVLLIVFFIGVFRPDLNLSTPLKVSYALVLLAFLLHMSGLALRWYVSGRAPWSNGYESMIYIAFTTMLAGVIFSRKSLGGLAATTLLASVILMVASLSYLDPEITPLVPVLKSYWLTIHVSLEAGSYGFLMLGAVIGVVNLILILFTTAKNKARIDGHVTELTYISEMTLIAGLFMISIGTYLGGVWANESWGRYWGWDAKETWALVTILVYAFILHMRFVPGLRGHYAFNVASLFGFASVVMTYFGVNYYLSGLHSYAAGDPVPIPGWVYYTATILAVLSILSYINKRRLAAKIT